MGTEGPSLFSEGVWFGTCDTSIPWLTLFVTGREGECYRHLKMLEKN